MATRDASTEATPVPCGGHDGGHDTVSVPKGAGHRLAGCDLGWEGGQP
jgi:hypothetical protein